MSEMAEILLQISNFKFSAAATRQLKFVSHGDVLGTNCLRPLLQVGAPPQQAPLLRRGVGYSGAVGRDHGSETGRPVDAENNAICAPLRPPVPSSSAGVQDLERAHRRGPVVEDKRSADQYAVHARDGGLHAPLRFTPLGRVRGQLVSLLSHDDFPRFYVESVLG